MKRLLKIAAVLLALTTLIMSLPLSAFAASGKSYISEVTTCEAYSFSEAKEILEADGFTIVGSKDDNSKLNGSNNMGVYLGYKTTPNPDEAITDLAVMNMKGNFSEAKYQKILEDNRTAVSRHIDELLVAVAAFQNNCRSGKEAALIAYENLNNYTEEEVGLIGDYLLKYDLSSKTHDKLTDIFMKGSTEIIQMIELLLVMASETEETSFLERTSKIDYDTLEEAYCEEYGDYRLASDMMDRDFGETANGILAGWVAFREGLLSAEDYVIIAPDGSLEFNEANVPQKVLTDEERVGLTDEEIELIEAYYDEINLNARRTALASFSLYCALDSFMLGDISALKFFMTPVADVMPWELYTMVYAMNETQRLHVRQFGIGMLLEIAFAQTSANSDVDRVFKAPEPISVYNGVDLSIYDKGVAFTDLAQRYERLTGDNWFESVTNGTASADDYYMGVMITSCVAFASLYASVVTYIFQGNTRANKALFNNHINLLKFDSDDEALGTIENYLITVGQKTYTAVSRARREVFNEIKEMKQSEPAVAFNVFAQALDYGTFIIFFISFISDILYIIQLITAEEAVGRDIPHHIVTAEATRDGSFYIYYAAVKNRNGNPANLNKDSKDSEKTEPVNWLTLYCTKDSKAGSPIEVGSIKVQRGSSTVPKGSVGVHLFGDAAAANVTAKTFTGKSDSVNGTYIFFTRDVNAYTASVFSVGSLAAAGAGGLLIGLALGLVPMLVFKGRKKKDEYAEQQ